LGKQPIDALAYVIAFCMQGAYFLLQLGDKWRLLTELHLGFYGAILGGSAQLALAFDEFDGTHDAFFESRKVVRAKSQGNRFSLQIHGLLLRLRV
jgi:hypothetical protein